MRTVCYLAPGRRSPSHEQQPCGHIPMEDPKSVMIGDLLDRISTFFNADLTAASFEAALYDLVNWDETDPIPSVPWAGGHKVVAMLASLAGFVEWSDYPALADEWLQGMLNAHSKKATIHILIVSFRFEWLASFAESGEYLVPEDAAAGERREAFLLRGQVATCIVHARAMTARFFTQREVSLRVLAGLSDRYLVGQEEGNYYVAPRNLVCNDKTRI